MNFQKETYHKYVVTGTNTRGIRFRLEYSHALTAMSINLLKGSVWGVKENGKRRLLKRV